MKNIKKYLMLVTCLFTPLEFVNASDNIQEEEQLKKLLENRIKKIGELIKISNDDKKQELLNEFRHIANLPVMKLSEEEQIKAKSILKKEHNVDLDNFNFNFKFK